MNKPNQQVIIDFIISCLKKGEQRGNILVKAGKKWGTSKSAFDRLLKIAKDEHAKAHAAIQKELAEVEMQSAVNGRKKEIMTVLERKLVLTQIANGSLKLKKWWIGKDYEICKAVVPDYIDRKNAIAELNKMDGSYAAEKIETTHKIKVTRK